MGKIKYVWTNNILQRFFRDFFGGKREKGRKLGIKEDTVFPSGWTEIWMLSNLNPSSVKVFGWGASATAAPVHST